MMERELTLARDEDGYYGIYEDEPEKNSVGDWSGSLAHADMFPEEDFHAIFGCHPIRKGRKKRIKRILIELED